MSKLFTIWSSNISPTYTSSIPSHPRVHWPRIIHYTLQLSLHWQTRASRACCCWPWLFTSRPSPRFPPRWPRLARGSTSSPAFWLALGTLVDEGIGWYLRGVVVFIDERNSHWLDVHNLFCTLIMTSPITRTQAEINNSQDYVSCYWPIILQCFL